MHGEALVFVLLLVFGCAAFLFGVVYLVCQILARVGRGVWGVFRPSGGAAATGKGDGSPAPRSVPPAVRPGAEPRARRRVCPNKRCRRIEDRAAHYCSQCGTPLR